ncbi:MAG: hypothetical protein LBH00_05115 [Planctomycetaceae bacterium]|jgi:hypothetical protein|nr:hypothetical protein [Planctomycetaceae bacterium]
MAKTKQTKAAAKAETKPAETTAQEYYLSYYETKYPPCHSVFDDDPAGLDVQRGKPCFTQDYMDRDCSPCHTHPCPEQQTVLTYRCSIGKLTDEEKDLLLKRTGIMQEGFDLSPIETDALTLEERLEHQESLKLFRAKVRQHNDNDISLREAWCGIQYDDDILEPMIVCFNTAHAIRAVQQQTNPEPAVHEQMPVKPNEWADKPETIGLDKASTKEILHKVITESKYMDEKAAEWDLISRTEYDGAGWAALAILDLTKNKRNAIPGSRDVRNLAQRIRTAVLDFRKRHNS